MKCSKCGAEMPDGQKFCTGCGAKLMEENVVNTQTSYVKQPNAEGDFWSNPNPYAQVQAKDYVSQSMTEVLVSPTEKIIATLGNDYLQNIIINNNVQQFSLVLTDKRVYFKGNALLPDKKNLGLCHVEKFFDLADINEVGFVSSSNWNIVLIVLSVGLCLVGLVGINSEIGVFFIIGGVILITIALIQHYCSKGSFFLIGSHGNNMLIDIKLYGKAAAHDFSVQLMRAKDRLLGRE